MRKVFLATALFVIYYGIYVVLLQQFVRHSMHPLWLSALSFSLAGFLILLFLAVSGKLSLLKLSRPAFKWSTAAAFFAAVMGDVSALLGLQLSSAINWTLLLLLAPIVTFTLSRLFLSERTTQLKLLSLIMGVVGAVFVVYQPENSLNFNPGDALFILAVLGYGFSNITTSLAASSAPARTVGFFRIILAGPMLLLLSLVFPIDYSFSWSALGFNTLSVILGTILITYVIAKAGAVFFALSNNLIPLVTVLATFFLLGDLPSVWQLLGGLVIMLSIYLFTRPAHAPHQVLQ